MTPPHPVTIRTLDAADAAIFQRLRLQALAEEPTAFASSHAEEVERSLDEVGERLAVRDDRFVLGAFDGEELVGMMGILRDAKIKRAHKAFLWGMYVRGPERDRGIGRALLLEALDRARGMPGLMQIYLGVITTNEAALKLYEDVGFVTYGREPAYMVVDGVAHDQFLMACPLGAG